MESSSPGCCRLYSRIYCSSTCVLLAPGWLRYSCHSVTTRRQCAISSRSASLYVSSGFASALGAGGGAVGRCCLRYLSCSGASSELSGIRYLGRLLALSVRSALILSSLMSRLMYCGLQCRIAASSSTVSIVSIDISHLPLTCHHQALGGHSLRDGQLWSFRLFCGIIINL